MKKIVALVLSLVMVLGLATTAFAVDYQVDSKSAATMTANGTNFTVTVTPAVDAYIDVAGNLHNGSVMYYTDPNGVKYVPCTADTAGADIWYYAGTKTVFDTVVATQAVNYVYYASEFTNFGKACGQLNNEGFKTAKFYTYTDGDDVTYIYKAVTGAPANLMVDGKLVAVDTTVNYYNQLNAHKWVVEKNAKNEVVAAKCSLCAVEATWVRNLASVPATADYEAGFGGYLYWNAAPVATEPADKVESAQTFDAGIAMYVGMSVMAAAGSAVVLKKKD